MLVEWSTIIRREMEIKANSAKFRMQSNPTDWEQDTLLLSELFSFFSLFFLPFFFFHAENNIPLFFFFPYIFIYIFNTVDIYTDSSRSLKLLVYDDEISRTINVFRKSLATSQLIYYHIHLFFFLFFFFFFCFLNIITFSKLTPPTLDD